MACGDFMRNWDKIGICHLNPSTLREEIFDVTKKKIFYKLFLKTKFFKNPNSDWNLTQFTSSWVKGKSAGGRNEAFWSNPQFHVEVKDVNRSNQKESLIIALMQKDNSTKKSMLYIHFQLYKVNFFIN